MAQKNNRTSSTSAGHRRMPAGLSARIAMIALLACLAPAAGLAQEPPAAPIATEAGPAQAQPETSVPATSEAAQERAPAAAPMTGGAPAGASDMQGAGTAPESPAQAETLPTSPEPAPSFLEDPAGALGSLLDAPERDASLPHDLSPWGMFMAADWVVKAVMIGLALASLGVWTVWAAKTVEIACAKARARRAVAAIASASSLADAGAKLAGRGGPAAFMVRSAEDELRRSSPALDHAGNDGVKERLGTRLARIEAQSGRRLARGTGLLATVGSTAPFIGLFGTVWGIMNSFIGISEANTTNLAVVAPGIAEALLATAIGLVAAIPAVIVYNVFARSIAGYGQLLADAASGVEQLVSLDLDLRKVPVRTKSLALKPDTAAEAPSARAPEATAASAAAE